MLVALYPSVFAPRRWASLNATQAYRRLSTAQLANGENPNGLDILFFGRDAFSCEVFRQVHRAQDVIRSIQITTTPDERLKRRDVSNKWSVSPLKELGKSMDLPVHEIPEVRRDLRTWELPPPFPSSPHLPPTTTNLSHVLITASFGRILPASLLNRFHPDRRLNVHPSLLPLYRGPAPIQRALMDGRKETGVCVIGMTEFKKGGGVDLGDIWGRRTTTIEEGATFSSLRDELATQGGKLLVEVLRDILRGQACSQPQAPGGPYPYAHFITHDDSLPRWSQQNAEQLVWIHNAIGEQRPLTSFMPDGSTYIQLHEPSVVDPVNDTFPHISEPGTAFYHKPADALFIRCANNSLLSVKALKQQNSKLVPAKAFWNGVRPAWCGEVEGHGKTWKVVRFHEPGTV